MNAGNAAELLAKPDIDGGLVGGASLKADFGKIVNYKQQNICANNRKHALKVFSMVMNKTPLLLVHMLIGTGVVIFTYDFA